MLNLSLASTCALLSELMINDLKEKYFLLTKSIKGAEYLGLVCKYDTQSGFSYYKAYFLDGNRLFYQVRKIQDLGVFDIVSTSVV